MLGGTEDGTVDNATDGGAGGTTGGPTGGIENDVEIQLERLRSPEIRERLGAGWRTVVFAAGAVEQHGPHLPLFVDAEHGSALAVEVARRLGRALVAPTIRVGCSEHHMHFAGTVSLRQSTFEAVCTDYCTSFARHGFRWICILPTHGGNFGPVVNVLPALREAAGPDVRVDAFADLIGLAQLWRDVVERHNGLGERVGGHADIAETAIMLRLHPSLVREDLAEPGFAAELTRKVVERIIKEGFHTVTANGILGDARGADAPLGRKLIEALADRAVEYFRAEAVG